MSRGRCIRVLRSTICVTIGQWFIKIDAVFLSGLQIWPAWTQNRRPTLAQANPGLHLKSPCHKSLNDFTSPDDPGPG
jgi:hypothetical protein